jgi:hypothetical protein
MIINIDEKQVANDMWKVNASKSSKIIR